MKYIILIIFLLLYLIGEIIFIGIVYVFKIIWNFRIPDNNIWSEFHSGKSILGNTLIVDKNTWQTFLRRYNYIKIEESKL